MKILQELPHLPQGQATALTIGVFDGVHRGHRHLLGELIARGKATGHRPGVVTFRAHPAHVLRPGSEPHYLCTLAERLRLLEQAGIGLVVPVTFDLALSKLSAREFVTLLQERLRMRELIVGPDFAMGHHREGDVAALAKLGREMGFTVTVVEPLRKRGQVVGSTAIRDAVAKGDLEQANRLLGRNYALEGKVVRGQGRGKPLGFPTANLEPEPGMVVPGNGIYAAWAHAEGRRFMAPTSVGINPTFNDTGRTVEAFLLDFEGNLYGERLRLEFVRRLRDELKFDSVEALQRQVDEDVAETRKLLKAAK
jgi:riboflavin kinase/FMN adenylyltransferase